MSLGKINIFKPENINLDYSINGQENIETKDFFHPNTIDAKTTNNNAYNSSITQRNNLSNTTTETVDLNALITGKKNNSLNKTEINEQNLTNNISASENNSNTSGAQITNQTTTQESNTISQTNTTSTNTQTTNQEQMSPTSNKTTVPNINTNQTTSTNQNDNSQTPTVNATSTTNGTESSIKKSQNATKNMTNSTQTVESKSDVLDISDEMNSINKSTSSDLTAEVVDSVDYKKHSKDSIKNISATIDSLYENQEKLEDKIEELDDKLTYDYAMVPTAEGIGEDSLTYQENKERIDEKTKINKEFNDKKAELAQLNQMIMILKQQEGTIKFECVRELKDFDEVVQQEIYDTDFDEIVEKNSKYLDEYQINVMKYWYQKEGIDKVDEYVGNLKYQINQYKGIEEANDFLEELEKNPDSAASYLNTTVTGGLDGICTFGEGITNFFDMSGDRTPSILEYKQMYILQVLAGDAKYKELTDKAGLEKLYQISTTVGNMLPVMAITTATTWVTGGASLAEGTAATVGKIAGGTAMGLSAGGNSKKQALESGSSLAAAQIYGICSGVSEAGLEYLLGGLPGISKGSQSILKEMINEGKEEAIQEVVSAILGKEVLGQEIDLGSLVDQSTESFAMGVIVSAVMHGGSLAIKGGKNLVVDTSKLYEMYKAGNYDGVVNEIQTQSGEVSGTVNEETDIAATETIATAESETGTTTTNKLSISKYLATFTSKIKNVGASLTTIKDNVSNLNIENYDVTQTQMEINDTIEPIDDTIFTSADTLLDFEYHMEDGITFLSQTKEGLSNLKEYYSGLKEMYKGNQNVTEFLNLIKDKGLTIADYDTSAGKDQLGFKKAFFSANNKTICLGAEHIQNKAYSTLLHEGGHFIDWMAGNYTYSNAMIKPLIDQIQPNIFEKITTFENANQDYLKRLNESLNSKQNQLYLQQKTMKKINEYVTDYTSYSNQEQNEIYTQIYNDLYIQQQSTYIRESGMSAISDIIDAITEGQYADKYKASGHGSKYFSINGMQEKEIIAQYSALHNANQENLIDIFISKEFRQGLDEVYSNLGKIIDETDMATNISENTVVANENINN